MSTDLALELADLLDRYRAARHALETVTTMIAAQPAAAVGAATRIGRANEFIDQRVMSLSADDETTARARVWIANASLLAVTETADDPRICESLVHARDELELAGDTFAPVTDLQLAIAARRAHQPGVASVALERAADRVTGAGLNHLEGELFRESVVLALSNPEDPDAAALTTRFSQIPERVILGDYVTTAYIDESYALSAVARGDVSEALGFLTKAIERVLAERSRDDLPKWDERGLTIEETALHHVVARLSHELGADDDELRAYRVAVRLAERIRAGWQVGHDEGNDPFWPLFRQLFVGAAGSAARIGESAARVAFEIVEISKRSGLAGSLLLSAEIWESLGADLAERITALEEASRFNDASLLRPDLRAEVSEVFSDLILPDEIDVDGVLESVKQVQVLDYFVTSEPDELPSGIVVWIDCGKPRSVVPFSIAEADRAWVDGGMLSGPGTRLVRLGATLLPAALAERLRAEPDTSLVISPDGPLTLMPWPALVPPRTDRHLVESCTPQLTPAVSLAESGRRTARRHAPGQSDGVLAVLPRNSPVRQNLRAIEVEARHVAVENAAMNRKTLEDSLRERRFGALYACAHGQGVGLQQFIDLDGEACSAAWAMTLPWPPLVVLISCQVGAPELRAARHPMGLVVSCLARGAERVVGAVGELIPDDGIRDTLLHTLVNDGDVVEALAVGQREFLERWRSKGVMGGSVGALNPNLWALPAVYSLGPAPR